MHKAEMPWIHAEIFCRYRITNATFSQLGWKGRTREKDERTSSGHQNPKALRLGAELSAGGGASKEWRDGHYAEHGLPLLRHRIHLVVCAVRRVAGQLCYVCPLVAGQYS